MFSIQEDLSKYNVLFISSAISHVVNLLIFQIAFILLAASYNILLITFYRYLTMQKNVTKKPLSVSYRDLRKD